MTGYIDLGKPEASELCPGDVVTMKHESDRAVPFSAVVWQAAGGALFAGADILRYGDGTTGSVWKEYVITVRRPTTTVPTEPWSVIIPFDVDAHVAYVLDGEGRWFPVGGNTPVGLHIVAAAVAIGTHYVKGADA